MNLTNKSIWIGFLVIISSALATTVEEAVKKENGTSDDKKEDYYKNKKQVFSELKQQIDLKKLTHKENCKNDVSENNISMEISEGNFKKHMQELENLASKKFVEGKYDEAEKTWNEELIMSEEIYGKKSIKNMGIKSCLSMVATRKGYYEKSKDILKQSVDELDQSIGDKGSTDELEANLIKMNLLTQLEQAYRVTCEYENTKITLIKLSKLQDDIINSLKSQNVSPKISDAIGNLKVDTNLEIGHYYIAIGDYKRGLDYFLGGLKYLEKNPLAYKDIEATQGVTFATLNSCVGGAYLNIGEYDRSLYYFEKAKENYQKNNQIPDTAGAISNEANIYFDKKDFEQALIKQQEANQLVLNIYGADSVELAIGLSNISAIYRKLGRYDFAKKFQDDSIQIIQNKYGHNSVQYGIYLEGRADDQLYGDKNIQQAVSTYEQCLNAITAKLPDSDYTVFNLLGKITPIYKTLGLNNESLKTGARYKNELYKKFKTMFVLGEKQRLAWSSKYINFFTISSGLPTSQIVESVFQLKGSVLDSLVEDKNNAKKAFLKESTKIKYHHILELKNQIASLSLGSSKINSNYIEGLQRQLDSEESVIGLLNARSARTSFTQKIDQLSEVLTPEESIVDIVCMRNPIGDEMSLGIAVISKNSQPQWIVLNNSKEINQSISSYRKAIATGDEAALKAQIQILSEKLWSPIAAVLPPDTKKIYLGADGPLNFLSFATILDDQGKFLSEKYQIAYIGSGRDLLRPAKSNPGKNFVIYANPVFYNSATNHNIIASTNASEVGLRAVELAEFAKVQLPQLPGTELEAAIVSQIAKDAQWSDEVHLGSDASKKGVMAMKAPTILHLATHGFFLGGDESGGTGERGMKLVVEENSSTAGTSGSSGQPAPYKGISPMRQSGVALSGGESTLRAWGRGEFPDPSNDGILTAEEVSGLELEGTWLVTLSACETGVGQVQSGEGVFGLRRAFMMAGAQNLLMTLWPVSDEVTPKIMADFYKKALATHDAAGALSDVQRDWLVKLRNEKGLLAAVRDAGPFAMVVMANPNVKETSDTAAMQSAGGGQTNTALGSSPEVAFASALPTPDYSVSEELPPPISSLVDAVVPPSASGTDASSPSGSAQAGSGKVLSFEEAASRADAGDAYAQAVVSIYYKVGYKVPIDLSLSAKYAMKSAAQNNPLGIYQLGSLRTQGKGMEKNPQQGLALQKKALEGIKAMPEDPYAITFSGQFNAKNNPEGAFNLYQQAAGMGYPVAVALLSNCYHYGTGTAKNSAMAAKTMKMAADMGLGLAQQAEALIESAGRN